MRVVVTGGAGFIGGETVLKLLEAGHSVLSIDRQMPTPTLRDSGATWHTGDFASELALDSIRLFAPDAIIHCAGSIMVGESVKQPADYYNNNFVKTASLLNYLVSNKLMDIRVIFSSSAGVYGDPVMTPIQEIDPKDPISPYGQSKLMVDWMLSSYRRAYGLDFVSFRYFNACGADSQARHGQAPGASHIIARILESVKDSVNFYLYGVDYNTPDGTCVRDYIHVEDLVQAHILALDKTIPSDVYNLGTNAGHSNLEIIQMAADVTQTAVTHTLGPRREGDPAVLTADASKFTAVSGWQPKFNLRDIIAHAWAWYNK